MKATFDIDIEGTDGDYTIVSASKLPLKEEFVEQIETLEEIIGEAKAITITFKEEKQ